MKENMSFILIFTAMMVTIMLLHGCTRTQTIREPMKLVLFAECNPDGGAILKFEGIDEVSVKENKLEIEDLTQGGKQ